MEKKWRENLPFREERERKMGRMVEEKRQTRVDDSVGSCPI